MAQETHLQSVRKRHDVDWSRADPPGRPRARWRRPGERRPLHTARAQEENALHLWPGLPCRRNSCRVAHPASLRPRNHLRPDIGPAPQATDVLAAEHRLSGPRDIGAARAAFFPRITPSHDHRYGTPSCQALRPAPPRGLAPQSCCRSSTPARGPPTRLTKVARMAVAHMRRPSETAFREPPTPLPVRGTLEQQIRRSTLVQSSREPSPLQCPVRKGNRQLFRCSRCPALLYSAQQD
jgi:hypothetical protein